MEFPVVPLLEPIPNKVYYLKDHIPHQGIETVQDLDMVAKRETLFGSCILDQVFTPQHRSAAIMFGTYIDIELKEPHPTKIFFPEFFIDSAHKLKNRLHNFWPFGSHRTRAVACPMHNPRELRLVSSCWLANNPIDMVYTQHWDPGYKIHLLDEILQIGGLKDWSGTWGPTVKQMPQRFDTVNTPSDIPRDFALLYDSLFSHSASCVLIGAVLWERACEIDEKYLFAVVSGCIPLVQGYRAYDRLRDLGFETFDDIIDTRSQYETNPVLAAWRLWEDNREFFDNAVDIWYRADVQKRLRHNFELARDFDSLYHNVMYNLNNESAREVFEQHRLPLLTLLGLQRIY